MSPRQLQVPENIYNRAEQPKHNATILCQILVCKRMIFLLSLLYNQIPIPTQEKSLPSQVTANKNPYHFKEWEKSNLTNSNAPSWF